jgi:hypothetical protein
MKVIFQFLRGLAFAAGLSVHGRDLSKLDPFCDYVGHSVELRRPMSVIESSSSRIFFSANRGVIVKRHADHGLAEVGQEGESKIFGILPVGHPIRIIRVSEETHFDTANIIAYGRTKLPWNEKEITIAYSWADLWTLHPAPWEPDDTPPVRAPGIKLPPHFNYDSFNHSRRNQHRELIRKPQQYLFLPCPFPPQIEFPTHVKSKTRRPFRTRSGKLRASPH